jgi:hypothetical protein
MEDTKNISAASSSRLILDLCIKPLIKPATQLPNFTSST